MADGKLFRDLLSAIEKQLSDYSYVQALSQHC